MNLTRKSSAIAFVRLLLLCVPLMLASPSKAEAYADPGTGAFIYQAAYAAILGVAFYFRKFIGRFFGKRK